MTRKNVLIVYAHPERKSFNAALLDCAVRTLEDEGHEVVVSDLYAMGFDPLIGRSDVKGLAAHNPEHISYCDITSEAWSQGTLADDIVQELNKISAADLVIFQFPLQWSTVPAIMKGWFDRVLVMKYAFTDNEVFDKGKLKGKKAMLSFTTGAPEMFYSEYGPHGDMNVVLWPIQNCILRFVGFEVLPPHIIYGPGLPVCTDEHRQQMLAQFEHRLINIWQDQPLSFIPIKYFSLVESDDPLKGMKLDTEAVCRDRKTTSDNVNTVGQHMGKPLPKDSMLLVHKDHNK